MVSSNTSDVIGIDLGTTNSCVAVYQYGRVEMLVNAMGNALTPSVVAYKQNGERVVGGSAKRCFTSKDTNPSHIIYEAKRLIGRTFNDPDVQRDRDIWTFEIEKGPTGLPLINLGSVKLRPEDISTAVLAEMKQIGKDKLNKDITRAVITVPAYFNDAQRRATITAGEGAKLKVEKVINEPTAAALAFGLLGEKNTKKNVLIYDLGGGTLDVTVMHIDGSSFKVLSTTGDTHLGGADFDNLLVDWCLGELKKTMNINLKGKKDDKSRRALAKLRKACEQAKIDLSTTVETPIDFEHAGDEFDVKMTKARWEEICAPLFKKCLHPVDAALQDAKKKHNVKKSDLKDIVLVGGSSRIPKVQDMLREYFGKELNKQANPDEAVAYGAAVQGAMISGHSQFGYQEIHLTDSTPFSVGLETVGGVMVKMIPKQSPTPAKFAQAFTLNRDNQDTISLSIFEGEDDRVCNNRLLNKYDLTGIPPMKVEDASILVTFEINENNVLIVTAVEEKTRKQIRVEVTNLEDISQQHVQQVQENELKFQRAGEAAADRAQAANDLEAFCNACRAEMKGSAAGKLSSSQRDTYRRTYENALKWLEDNRMKGGPDIRAKLNEARNTCYKIMPPSNVPAMFQ